MIPVLAIAQLGLGAYQMYQGSQEKKALEGKNIPPELLKQLSNDEIAALEGLPDESVQFVLDNIQASQAASIRGLNSRNAGVAGIASVQRQTNNSLRQLGSADAQQRIANAQTLRNTRLKYADLQRADYEAALESAQSNIGAGIQNIYGAAETTSGLQQLGAFQNNNAGATDTRLSDAANNPYLSIFASNYVNSPNYGSNDNIGQQGFSNDYMSGNKQGNPWQARQSTLVGGY